MLRQYVYPKFLLKISKACYTELIYLGCCGETNPGIETRVQLWVVLEFDEELCEFGSCVLGQGSIYGSGENFAKESSLKLREGSEVQREVHLLDKTPVLMASLVGSEERISRRTESGKALIRSCAVSVLCRLVRWLESSEMEMGFLSPSIQPTLLSSSISQSLKQVVVNSSKSVHGKGKPSMKGFKLIWFRHLYFIYCLLFFFFQMSRQTWIRILSISFEMERPPVHGQDFSENDPRLKIEHVINLTQTTWT